MEIPRLETERLLLREWREATDFEPYAAMCADENVMRYIGGKVYSTLESWRHMALIVGHWELRGFGHWAVEEKATGAFIGRIGVQHPVGWPDFEIGWTIAPDRHRRGYATEGARAVVEYVFTELDRSHVISLIHPDNAASIAVATRLGETKQGETQVFDIGCLIYGITRERWHELNPR